jgi:aspartyl-tRNA(Asn)/glutamyl-tRNA(Gln) amidotransferase subunit C
MTKVKITREEVNRVAHLARLELNNGEEERLTGDLNNILGYVDKLNELDTDGVEPACHAVPVTNAFRDDERKDYFTVSEGLANAPDEQDGSFKVPKVID